MNLFFNYAKIINLLEPLFVLVIYQDFLFVKMIFVNRVDIDLNTYNNE